MTRDAIWAAILDERAHQADKWGGKHEWGEGDCSSRGIEDIVKAAVLAEECGEVSRAVLDYARTDALRVELIQVAAVAVAWLEAL